MHLATPTNSGSSPGGMRCPLGDGAQTHHLAQASFKRAKLGGEERAATLGPMITNVASPGCLLSSAPMTCSLLMENFNLPFTALYPLASVPFLAFLPIVPTLCSASSPRTYTWPLLNPIPQGLLVTGSLPNPNNRLLRWLSGKEFTCRCRRHRRTRFNTWDRKMPWRKKRKPMPVF